MCRADECAANCKSKTGLKEKTTNSEMPASASHPVVFLLLQDALKDDVVRKRDAKEANWNRRTLYCEGY
jgi:hypothetical protein